MNVKRIQKSVCILGACALTLVRLWIVFCELPLTFTPLRFLPQEITVYRYGESVTLTPSDIDFYRLYHRLRQAGKGTIAHWWSHDGVIMDSHMGNFLFEDEEDVFCRRAIVAYVNYDSMQKGRLPGATGEEYNQVIFVMDGEQSSLVDRYLTAGVPALYRNTESRRGIRLFANYGSLDKAAAYVEAMDFSQ